MGARDHVARSRPSADSAGSVMDTLDRLMAAMEATAAAEEAGAEDIAVSIDRLRAQGWLSDAGISDPGVTAMRLVRTGAANLPVGRLWEGHLNALYLARVHGDVATARKVDRLVAEGAFLGVWGADGDVPVAPSADGAALRGHKVFASGLGTVTHAVVTVSSGPDVRLALVDVRDRVRADASGWNMEGMRATASGRYDMDGIPERDILWLGGPGDYLTEPHFVGGVWRIAALQTGGSVGLLDAAAAELRARGRLDAPAQMARLSAMVVRSLGASALVTHAARMAAPGAPMAPEACAALSAASRLLSEEVGLDVIRAVEQCIGLAHFETGSVTGRKARDLAVYMRQAARDAFQTRVGEASVAREGDLWTLF